MSFNPVPRLAATNYLKRAVTLGPPVSPTGLDGLAGLLHWYPIISPPVATHKVRLSEWYKSDAVDDP